MEIDSRVPASDSRYISRIRLDYACHKGCARMRAQPLMLFDNGKYTTCRSRQNYRPDGIVADRIVHNIIACEYIVLITEIQSYFGVGIYRII